jgi:glycosyltransferase involved in cell wall biosynthesis
LAKLVILVSQDDLDHLSSWIRHKAFASRLGVDTNALNPYYTPMANKHPMVLFFGSLDYLPNRQAVEEIYQHIAPAVTDRVPNAKFVIAGKQGRFTFEHPNVDRVGFVPDIAACIKQSDLVIVPLKMGSGMRMKIIESLACGKTVISTSEGAAGISDKFQNLVICNLSQFPQAIIQSLQTRPLVSTADFDLISRKYSWKTIVGEMQSEIESALGRGSTSSRRVQKHS